MELRCSGCVDVNDDDGRRCFLLCEMCGGSDDEDCCVRNADDGDLHAAETLFGEATAMAARRQHLRILLMVRFISEE
jgi:hypothetical protein